MFPAPLFEVVVAVASVETELEVELELDCESADVAVLVLVNPAFVDVVLAVTLTTVLEVFSPSPPVTPALSVGIVTLATTGTALVVFASVVVVLVDANVGHKAPSIFPACIMPNSELLVTETSSHAACTFAAIVFNPDTQAGVHPVLKSET